MVILAWLGVPAGATVLAIGWVHWVSRPRGPMETHESMAQRDRFNAAMARPADASSKRRRTPRSHPARDQAA